MTVKRAARIAAVLALFAMGVACGNYYRPVANPITPNEPNPSVSHFAVVIAGNGADNPGSSTTIDVSGDAAVSQSAVGLQPVHGALTPGGTEIFVANSLDDTVSLLAPSSAAPVTTISLPTGSTPAFVATTENATVYVANSGNNTVSAISTANGVITNTIPVGVHPIAMAEIPNGQKLYVANRGNNGGGSVTSINTIDKSVNVNPPLNSAGWISPVWVVSRSDSQRVYVLDSGRGSVSAIDTFSDSIVGTLAVGAGVDFMLYDPTLNRVYVTNPVTGKVSSLDASTDALTPTTVAVANAIALAALLDGSRIYVASATVTGNSVSSQVTVLNTADLSIKSTIPLASVQSAAGCASRTSFELFMAAAADSSRVYVGNCDAGNTAIIQTSNDTLLLQMPAPLSAKTPANGGTPPPQNPVFVLAGP